MSISASLNLKLLLQFFFLGLMCDCSGLVVPSTSLCQELHGPIVYCTRVSSRTGSINTTHSQTPLRGEKIHTRVWQQGTINFENLEKRGTYLDAK